MSPEDRPKRLRELAALYLKLGSLGFGGPATTISYMEEEVVGKRKWVSREYFLDMVGVTNLIPGPNAVEMAAHVGYIRAGWPGLVVSAASFIVPAVLISLGFAWMYVRYGSVPALRPFLYGIQAAVIAVIISALWRLGRVAVRKWRMLTVGVGVAAAVLLGANDIFALLGGGVLGMLWLRLTEVAKPPGGGTKPMAVMGIGAALRSGWKAATGAILAGGAVAAASPVTLAGLGLFFLKIGAVLYGTGYVLIAFLQGGLVQTYGWLTQQQLLDAIAVGQFTPGPLLSTATFIGYLLLGVPGAVVSTAAVFFPSFVFVAATGPLVPRLRRSAWTAAFLDAVNASALGLMAAVTVTLGRGALTSWPAWVIAGAAILAALIWRVNATWLILGGAVVGFLLSLIGG